jgi:hypothetical protein
MTSSRQDADSARYPVGRMRPMDSPAPEQRIAWIEDLERLPGMLRAAVDGLDPEQLDTPYREGGWTVRQVVHHLADSHTNGYIRFSLAVAETGRTLVAYDQDAWAALAFPRTGPLEPSLTLLEGLHARWAATARSLGETELRRTVEHPEDGPLTAEHLLNLYAWHSRHHVAHIRGLRERRGW